ncbi:MAG: hypothetical protein H0W96_05770, partial [Solirubrobacterales bacterium]|nr:hypothetical protein [Solirubrobacterales bacterium]
GGLREALLVAAGAAAADADHAILRGTAPAGKILRLRKRFGTLTSPFCEKGVEPAVNVGLPRICLTGEKPPLTLDDELDVQTTVPAGGSYAWHIGPSTRPFVGAVAGRKEAYKLTCEAPDGSVLETLSLVIDRGQSAAVNVGCGARTTTFADGVAVGGDRSAPAASVPTPSVNGITVPALVASSTVSKTKPRTRAQKLATCNRKASKIQGAKKRKAARKSCTRRYGSKPPK